MPDPIRIAELRAACDRTLVDGLELTPPVIRALLDVAEAANEASEYLRSVYRSLPVRDDTRDAHFDLEHARIRLRGALARLDFTQ